MGRVVNEFVWGVKQRRIVDFAAAAAAAAAAGAAAVVLGAVFATEMHYTFHSPRYFHPQVCAN
jgi:hypothetical protein